MTTSDDLHEAEAHEDGHGTQPTGAPGLADLVTGLVCAAVGIAVIAYAMTLPTLGGGRPGPGLFPGIIGGAFVLFGGVLSVQALLGLRRRRAEEDHRRGAPADTAPERDEETARRARTVSISGTRLAVNAAVVLLGIVGYILLADVLGFLITLFLVAFAIMLTLRARPVPSAVMAAVIAVAMWLVFEELLRVQLPDGLLV